MQPQDPLQQSEQPNPQQQPESNNQFYAPATNGAVPQATYNTRPVMPIAPYIPPDISQKHEESKKQYPELNLSAGEYVITVVHRHPIGLVKLWGGILIGIIALVGGLFLFTAETTPDTLLSFSLPPSFLALIAISAVSLAFLIGYIGTYVYRANNMYLTNESVIQNIQMTPFAHRKQTVSLSNIEDASYTKPGILSMLFDFGEIRLSTEGDETTYRFHYAADPDKQVATLNDAVEAFKNGRPIYHD